MIVYNREQIEASVTGKYPNIDCLYNTIKRETRKHMERVGAYAECLYRYLLKYYEPMVRNNVPCEFDEVSEELFRYHDLGMTYVPGVILNKVERLTEEEKQIIKNHTIYANDAIKAIYEKYYSDVQCQCFLDIAVGHHERYDGEGYPYNMSGRHIPFLARICGIADAFDGITSWKPYKTVQTSREKAAEIIMSERGRQFDPFITDIFVKIIPGLPEV